MEIKDESNPRKAQLIGIVKGIIPQPTTMPELTKWKNKYLDARMELVMHLADEQIDLVKYLETSKEIWDALKKCHEPLGQNNKDHHPETPCHIGNGRK